MKSKIYEFNPVLYPFKIHITKDFDREELKSKYNAINAKDEVVAITDEFIPDTSTTSRIVNVTDVESGDIIYLILLFKPEKVGVGVVAHEAVHIANAYLQYIGFSRPSAYDDEPYAYFVEWLSNCIWSVVDDKTDVMNEKLLNNLKD